MIVDYEKLKEDLGFHVQKNNDLSGQLGNNMAGRRKAEDEVLRLQREYDDFKNKTRDTQACDSREIVNLQGKVRDLQ